MGAGIPREADGGCGSEIDISKTVEKRFISAHVDHRLFLKTAAIWEES